MGRISLLGTGNIAFSGNEIYSTNNNSLLFGNDLIPTTISTFNIGSSANPFKTLFISASTLSMAAPSGGNNLSILNDGNNFQITNGGLRSTVIYTGGLLISGNNIGADPLFSNLPMTIGTNGLPALKILVPTTSTSTISTTNMIYASGANIAGNLTLPDGVIIGNTYGDGQDGAIGLGAGSSTGSYAIINSNDLEQYVEVNNNVVWIGTNYNNNTDSGLTWAFDKTGVLTLPQGGILKENNTTTTALSVTVVPGTGSVAGTGVNQSPANQWTDNTTYPAGTPCQLVLTNPTGDWLQFNNVRLYIASNNGTNVGISSDPSGNYPISVVTGTFNSGTLQLLSVVNGVVINTGVSNKSWSFGSNGNITFPDNTVQTTAYNNQTKYLPISGGTLTGNLTATNAYIGVLTTGVRTVSAVSAINVDFSTDNIIFWNTLSFGTVTITPINYTAGRTVEVFIKRPNQSLSQVNHGLGGSNSTSNSSFFLPTAIEGTGGSKQTFYLKYLCMGSTASDTYVVGV